MMRLSGSALILAASAVAGAAQTPIALDSFVEGLTWCDPAKPYSDYRTALGRSRLDPGSTLQAPRVRATPPAGVARAFGTPRVVNRGEFTVVTVPVSGTVRGLPVTALEFEFGNGNGILTGALVFGVDAGTVRSALRADIARNKMLMTTADGPITMSISGAAQGRLHCNWSM